MRSLVGYSPGSGKESDTTKWVSTAAPLKENPKHVKIYQTNTEDDAGLNVREVKIHTTNGFLLYIVKTTLKRKFLCWVKNKEKFIFNISFGDMFSFVN